MRFKTKNNTKMSSLSAASAGVVAGITMQLIGCLIVAWLTEKGSVAEEHTTVASAIIRIAGMIEAFLVSWWLSPNKKIADVLIALGIVMLLPLIATMLFWDIDVGALAVSIGSALTIIAAGSWMLNRSQKSSRWRFGKKGYR